MSRTGRGYLSQDPSMNPRRGNVGAFAPPEEDQFDAARSTTTGSVTSSVPAWGAPRAASQAMVPTNQQPWTSPDVHLARRELERRTTPSFAQDADAIILEQQRRAHLALPWTADGQEPQSGANPSHTGSAHEPSSRRDSDPALARYGTTSFSGDFNQSITVTDSTIEGLEVGNQKGFYGVINDKIVHTYQGGPDADKKAPATPTTSVKTGANNAQPNSRRSQRRERDQEAERGGEHESSRGQRRN